MKVKDFLYLLLLALLWAPAFLLVKVAIHELPPITMMALRVGLAVAILYPILRLQGRRLPGIGVVWLHFAITGFFSIALPITLISWAEQYIDSALAGMLMGLTPLSTVLLAHHFTTDDRFTAAKGVGVFLGIGGLLILLAPALLAGVQATTWGLAATITAAISYSVGGVYSRQTLRGQPPLVTPLAQLACATLYLLPLAWVIERPTTLALPSAAASLAVLSLAVGCTALPYVIYYWVMERMNATNLSMIGYLVPIVAAILGVFILGEAFTWNMAIGGALILLGVLVVNGVFQRFGRRRWLTPNRGQPKAIVNTGTL